MQLPFVTMETVVAGIAMSSLTVVVSYPRIKTKEGLQTFTNL